MEKIKLIWDFRGHDGKNTAIHHEKHLKEFFEIENKQLFESCFYHVKMKVLFF